MENKEEIVKYFYKYCSKCNGQCCKRGVFSVFNWEMQKLSSEFPGFHIGNVSEERGLAKDIAINGLCIFSKGNGCKLPIELRPTDCLTYPFYPKLKEVDGVMQIDNFVLARECPFNKEIATDKKLINAVKQYWKGVINKVNKQEILDWIGVAGCWNKWYKNAIPLKN